MPFHCHECDCPTMNEDGICDCCVKRKKNMVTSNKIGGTMVTNRNMLRPVTENVEESAQNNES